MITKRIASTLHNHRDGGLGWRLAGWIGLLTGTFVIVAVLVASRINAPLAVVTQEQQPVVGRALTVMGLVYDGKRYRNVPVQAAAKDVQPVVGRALTVMGLVYDGKRYRNVPVQVAASNAGRGYTVTALVYDGTTYRAAPVQVGGR